MIPDWIEELSYIMNIIKNGYSSYLDYYKFYEQLSAISTKKIISNPEQKKEWQNFLTQIHGKSLLRQDGKRTVLIDCSIELDRFENNVPQLIFEELKHDFLNELEMC